MSIKQGEAAITDEQLGNAHRQGALKTMREQLAWCKSEVSPYERVRCRLYPKLAFFFDGTGNNLWEELKKPAEERALSNIAKLYQAAVNDKEGVEAVPTYITGVGTPYLYPFSNISPNEDRGGLMGMGFGAGGDMRLAAALFEFRRLLEIEWSGGALRHMQWVSLSVFGFSRGATLARAFVRRLIAEQCERTAEGLVWKGTHGDSVRLRIVFMGLFETVASVGGPGMHLAWGSELAIPKEVERCVHHVAGHEVRQAFPLDSVRVGQSYPGNCEEVVYPGVHSDVGGGYFDGFQGRSNQLSRIPLRHMYAEALKSGVMQQRFDEIPPKDQAEMTLPDDSPVVARYGAYMDALLPSGGSLESLIHGHRIAQFQWRSAITRAGQDTRVLGALYRQVDPAMCEAVPAQNNHKTCPPRTWKYQLPRTPDEQARQLLAEHRRLVRHIPSIRNPMERQGDMDFSRPRTAYEDLIIAAWDSAADQPELVETFLAENVHDSVAHFTDWPCALHEQRGVYCDHDRYLARIPQQPATAFT